MKLLSGLFLGAAFTGVACQPVSGKSDNAAAEQSVGEEQPDPAESEARMVRMSGAVTLAFSANEELVARIDTVMALPIGAEGFQPSMLEHALEASIDSSGEFALDIPVDPKVATDWVLVLADSRAEPMDQFIGYIALRQDDADKWEEHELEKLSRLPLGKLKPDISGIELGTLRALRGVPEVQSELTFEQGLALFDMDERELLELAVTDDLLRGLENVIANSKPGYSYQPIISFQWRGLIDHAFGHFFDPTKFIVGGYGLGMMIDDQKRIGLENVCGAESGELHKSLAMLPPLSITQKDGKRVSPDSPFQNVAVNGTVATSEGHTCETSAPFVARSALLAGSAVTIDFGRISGIPPAGEWQIKVDGVLTALFDYWSMSPVDHEGLPSSYIPAPKINQDAQGHVVGIEMTWLLFNRQQRKHFEIINFNRFVQQTADLEVFLRDRNEEREVRFTLDGERKITAENGIHAITIDPQSDPWFIPETETVSGNILTDLVIRFRLLGSTMEFSFEAVEKTEGAESE